MAYGIKLVQILKHSIFTAREHLEDELHACSMFCYGTFHLVFFAIELYCYERVGQSYFFNTATCDNGLIVHVVECIFYGTAATVEN